MMPSTSVSNKQTGQDQIMSTNTCHLVGGSLAAHSVRPHLRDHADCGVVSRTRGQVTFDIIGKCNIRGMICRTPVNVLLHTNGVFYGIFGCLSFDAQLCENALSVVCRYL